MENRKRPTPVKPSTLPSATPSSKRRKSKEKSTRSITVGVRLDPKLRYLAEIAARSQRRSLSSFIEWAVDRALEEVILDDGSDDSITVAEASDRLWDVDEAERFARLALSFPQLLIHDEQILWKLIRQNGVLWKGQYAEGIWTWKVNTNSLLLSGLREHWEKFVKVARGKASKDTLPKRVAMREPAASKSAAGDKAMQEAKSEPIAETDAFADDIPF